ncbi:MAG: aspartate aminotransferase family protein [Deltaproteobacteria bacterium]|nr:aspartate aminotransferase family protein [Deltaproteobacteria bacterium]
MEIYKKTKSAQLEKLARQVIPGGVMSNFKKDENYHPTYMKYGKGSRIYDVDGNEYIDYDLSYGPSFLGHSNEHLIQSIEKQARQLYCAPVNDLAVEAARKVCEHVPSAEMLRFACSGTEANLFAIRVARGYTGRNMTVRFHGHYHGGGDSIVGGIVTDPENPVVVPGEREDDFWTQMTNSAGGEKYAKGNCYMIDWNDLPALEKLLTRYGHDIAAVIMEPVMTNWFGCVPEPGYLEGVRKLCTEYGVVLIFDEVLTGFRMGLGGAQGHFGVMPDMTTLAKCLGGGLPVSAFCGKREIMDVVTRTDVTCGGTYNGHPLAMAGVIATIEELEKNDGAVYRHVEKLGNMVKEGMETIAKDHDQELLIQGFPAAWDFTFTPQKKIINNQVGEWAGILKAFSYSTLLQQRGVIAVVRLFTSTAHTEKDVQDTLDRADDAMKAYVKQEEEGKRTDYTLL